MIVNSELMWVRAAGADHVAEARGIRTGGAELLIAEQICLSDFARLRRLPLAFVKSETAQARNLRRPIFR